MQWPHFLLLFTSVHILQNIITSVWLLFLPEPIIYTSQFILLDLLSHVTSIITSSKYFVIYDVQAVSY